MGIAVIPVPSAASKTRYVTTLTSGTSYTVPAGVTYVNVTLFGGGGGGGDGAGGGLESGYIGSGGQVIATNVATTPGASIAYAIGAGGTGGINSVGGGTGGSTTFTGATTASGGSGGAGANSTTGPGPQGQGAGNGGSGATDNGSAGGAGKIEIEYWA